jgi:hypothetical protein
MSEESLLSEYRVNRDEGIRDALNILRMNMASMEQKVHESQIFMEEYKNTLHEFRTSRQELEKTFQYSMDYLDQLTGAFHIYQESESLSSQRLEELKKEFSEVLKMVKLKLKLSYMNYTATCAEKLKNG